VNSPDEEVKCLFSCSTIRAADLHVEEITDGLDLPKKFVGLKKNGTN
jgi:hypothetical protein